MTVTAKTLVESQYANASTTMVYTTPTATTTIIDKFTATNSSGSTATVSVYLVPSGGTAGVSNLIISALSLTAGTVSDITQLQNQILSPGDFISVLAGTASAIVIRGSGREVT